MRLPINFTTMYLGAGKLRLSLNVLTAHVDSMTQSTPMPSKLLIKQPLIKLAWTVNKKLICNKFSLGHVIGDLLRDGFTTPVAAAIKALIVFAI